MGRGPNSIIHNSRLSNPPTRGKGGMGRTEIFFFLVSLLNTLLVVGRRVGKRVRFGRPFSHSPIIFICSPWGKKMVSFGGNTGCQKALFLCLLLERENGRAGGPKISPRPFSSPRFPPPPPKPHKRFSFTKSGNYPDSRTAERG